MAPLATDKFKKVAPNTGWQLGASGISDAVVNNFSLVAGSGLPTVTGVIITVDRVDAGGAKTPDKMERIAGVLSGNNVTGCVRGYGGTAQAHAGGAVVEILIVDGLWNDVIDGLLAEHNQDGSHQIAISSQHNSDGSHKITTFAGINAPKGFMINGKIEVTDTAGITVAIKTLAGTDPSATDPVYIRIGNTVRSITAALSFALADGTNWMNAGSAELATKEIDYFAYFVWDSNSSAVDIAWSRIPYGNLVSDFSATTTNEKHLAGYSKFTTTDEVEVIGRFAATLSAGAGYTWSVPTYTAINLVQRPIFETRILTTLAVHTGFSAAPTYTSAYMLVGSAVFYKYDVSAVGTSNATTYSITLPFSAVVSFFGATFGLDNVGTGIVSFQTSSNKLKFGKNGAEPGTDGAGFATTGNKYCKVGTSYLIN